MFPLNRPLKLIPLWILMFLFGVNLLLAQKPNILLIISDDLNTNIGPYMDIDQHTPNLDRLAKEGVTFTRTYSQFPLCGPSRASLMSGLYPETNGVIGNSHVLGSYRTVTPALSDHPSMAGFFKERDYFSARVSKIYHMGVPGGIERGEAGGDDPDSWDYSSNIMGPETLSDGNIELLSPANRHYGSSFAIMSLKDELETTQTDYLATSQAIGILESRAARTIPDATNKLKPKPSSPFFLGLGLVRPHVPLIAPENCFEPYPASEMELPEIVVGDNVPEMAVRQSNERIWKMDETEQKKTISAYMASVRFMDQQVGRVLDALDRLDLRKNTIVIFISDHGYNLGEHGCWSKVSLWEGSVRVPMIISDPRYPDQHGSSSDAITELLDLYPTLVELGGFSKEMPTILQGNSLAPTIKNGVEIDELGVALTIGRSGKAATIRTDRWRYTRWGEGIDGGNEELYDHRNDPEEHYNLAQEKGKKKILATLRAQFDTRRKLSRTKME